MANRGSYPHPVIDVADDVSSSFDVINILVDSNQQDIEILYELRTDDPDIVALLDSGKAIHSLSWRCSSTISAGEMTPKEFARTPSGFRLRAWLDQQLVKGDVIADVRIVCATDLKALSWTNQHSDYDNGSFDLQAGDVLADAGFFRFNVEKAYDPLLPPIGSCFKFVRSESVHKRIQVAFDGNDAVSVQIPAKTFDNFGLFSHRPDLQISLVVLPALMETLSFIKNNRNDEPLDDKIWFVAIESLAEKCGGWDQTLLELAQKILESPIDTVIRSGLLSTEEDS